MRFLYSAAVYVGPDTLNELLLVSVSGTLPSFTVTSVGTFGVLMRTMPFAFPRTITRSVITANTTGVSSVSGGVLQSYKDNRILGNGTDGTPIAAVGLQ